MKALILILLSMLIACSDDPKSGNNATDMADKADSGGDLSTEDMGGDFDLPRLGVFTVEIDGSNLRLVADSGERLLTHVRVQSGTDWATATRYNVDIDGNGLAMEGEGGGTPNYAGTEIVVFRLSAPDDVQPIGGLDCDKVTNVCANSSWTKDGNLIALSIEAGSDGRDWLKRVTIDGELPAVSEVSTIPVPAGVFFPVDPHQSGDNATGSIVFSGTFNQGTMAAQEWTRPVWKMPAAGTNVIGEAEVVGCAICPSQGDRCCSYPTPEVLTGTNDARFSHDGQTVMWMQSNADEPAQIFGIDLYPYRQFSRGINDPSQTALDTFGAAPTTSHAYAEWSPDDSQLVYWEILLHGETPAEFRVAEKIFLMAPDGTDRRPVPLPEELCAVHPSFLDADTIIFSGWKCFGDKCSCAPAAM